MMFHANYLKGALRLILSWWVTVKALAASHAPLWKRTCGPQFALRRRLINIFKRFKARASTFLANNNFIWHVYCIANSTAELASEMLLYNYSGHTGFVLLPPHPISCYTCPGIIDLKYIAIMMGIICAMLLIIVIYFGREHIKGRQRRFVSELVVKRTILFS